MLRSIFVKQFIVTVIGMFLVVSAMMISQTFFFEKYYIDKKTASVESDVYVLTTLFANRESTDLAMAEVSRDFAQKHGSVIFYNEYAAGKFVIKFSSFAQITFRMFADYNFLQEQFLKGQEIYQSNQAVMDNGQSMSYNVQDSFGNNGIITVTAVTSNRHLKGLLFVYTSLQPIGEAVAVIENYYKIFALLSFTIVMVLAFISSRFLTKPLIHLNNVANKIAKFDFSATCQIHSKDEIGNLSNTLNFLSQNLKEKIVDLEKTNERLKVELEKRKKTEKMRRSFFASISHEIKTPISIITGYTEGILDGLEKGTFKEDYIHTIVDEVTKMNKLVSDMLDLSHLEFGNITLNLQPFSINRLVRYMVNKVPSTIINEKNLHLDVESTCEILNVYADILRIEQVLRNLLDNAMKYTPNHGLIKINIREEEDVVLIQIENTSPHFNEEQLERIWETFYRIEGSRNKEYGGTGLGLSIVKNILEHHKSHYTVQNTEIGVRFSFTLRKYKE